MLVPVAFLRASRHRLASLDARRAPACRPEDAKMQPASRVYRYNLSRRDSENRISMLVESRKRLCSAPRYDDGRREAVEMEFLGRE